MDKNVLIIDDDYTNNIICENLLKKTQAFRQVTSVLSVDEGIDYLRKYAGSEEFPHIILLDLRFTDQDKSAADFLQEATALCPAGTQFFILTSSIAKKDTAILQEFPFITSFISKPLTKEKIAQIIPSP